MYGLFNGQIYVAKVSGDHLVSEWKILEVKAPTGVDVGEINHS